MSRNSSARKNVQVNPFMQIAEKVEVREVEDVTAEVIEEQPTEQATPPQEQTDQPQEQGAISQEQPTAELPKPELKVLSIEEIKRKNEVLTRLTAKYDQLTEKRRKVENFEISHDRETASVIVQDATGEIFESNSPKTIGKLIAFWKEEFDTILAEVENEIRQTA